MPDARHRADDRSAARKGLLGALLTPVLVAALFVGGLVALSAAARSNGTGGTDGTAASAASADRPVTRVELEELQVSRERADRSSRSGGRALQVTRPVTLEPAVVDREWTTAPLNIWRGPRQEGPKVAVLEEGTKVAVTGKSVGVWREVVLQNPDRGPVARWLNGDYLAENKPKPEPTGPTLGGACTNGTSVAAGVSPNIVKVHQAVCADFPEITTYGTFRSDGEHSQGIAVDIMVSGDRGWQVAEFVRANAGALGVNYVIYAQRIWSVDRSSEGWRYMEDRGSTTANHYDHVHVTTY